jgi:hypothetical protein
MKYLSLTIKHIIKKLYSLNLTILGIFLVICLFFNISTLKAETELKEKLIEILNFNVAANDSIFSGDTLTVTVSFKTKLDCDVNVGLVLTGGFTLVTDTLKNRISSDSLQVEKDTIQYKTYYVKARDMVNSGISFGASIKLPDIKMILSPNTSLVDVSDPFAARKVNEQPMLEWNFCYNDPGDMWNNQDMLCETYYYTNLSYTLPAPPTATHHVQITGTVKFYDWWEPNPSSDKTKKGALNNVWLFFKKTSGTPTNNLYHPVPYQTVPKEGVHFVRCSPDGNFGFDFDYKIDSLMSSDPTAQWKIILFMGKENAAINIESDLHHDLIQNMVNPDRSGTDIRTYKIPISVPAFSASNDYTYNGADLFFEQFAQASEGALFRHATLARNFIAERRVILLTSNEIPPQINIVLRDNYGYAGFYNGTSIGVFQGLGYANIAAHEYGHYYHDFIDIKDNSLVGYNPIIEGWAVFFANSVMSWENNKYGDIRSYEDDLEMAPFYQSELDSAGTQLEYRPRFGNVNKVAVDPNIPKFACYLWNVYDSFEDGDFIQTVYEGKNNDDVHGLGKDVFDFFTYYCLNWGTYDEEYGQDLNEDRIIFKPEGFNRLLLETLNLDDDTKASIQQIYDFMEIESGFIAKQTNLEMRSPQITMTYSSPAGNPVDLLFATNTYSDNIASKSDYYYPSPVKTYIVNFNFANRESGTNIYKKISGVWNLQFNQPYDSEPSLYHYLLNNIARHEYKITGYKEYAGDDSHPHYIINTPLAKFGIASYDFYDNIIFPLPACNEINVNLLVNDISILDIEIFDFNMNLVQHFYQTSSVGLNKYTINLNDKLASGIYNLRITDKNNDLILLNKSFMIIKY